MEDRAPILRPRPLAPGEPERRTGSAGSPPTDGVPAGDDASRGPRGKGWWNLLPSETVVQVLEQAVRDGLAGLEPGQVVPEGLPHEIAQAFLREARQRARRVRGITKSGFLLQLQRAKHATLIQRDAALEELADLQQKTAELRKRLVDQGHELDDEEERVLDEELRAEIERLNRRAALSTGGGLEPAGVEQLLEVVRHQRREALVQSLQGYRERVGLLERRLNKLNDALEGTEEALRVLAERVEVDPGIASIFKSVQGLSAETPLRDVKREMLRVIFEANRELQRRGASG